MTKGDLELQKVFQKLERHREEQELKIKKEAKLYRKYNLYCPNPEKKEKDLPTYWNELNSLEKHRWIRENMAEKVVKNYLEVKDGRTH